MTYAHDLLDADPKALMTLARVMPMSRYRRDVPPAPWFAAKLVGTLHEDCGPCTQLVVKMAAEAGVDPKTVAAVVSGDLAAMPDDVRLAARFASASLAHDPTADALRAEVVARWGRRGLASIALALASARVYPTLKYALGHGHACTRIDVAGRQLAPRALQPVTL
ncbi:MAG: hypothetical protein U1F43_22485 [Myxococcota bacterium]